MTSDASSTHRQFPAQPANQLSLQQVQLPNPESSDLRIVSVRAERVAEGFGSDATRGDEESMDREGGEGEGREVKAEGVQVWE